MLNTKVTKVRSTWYIYVAFHPRRLTEGVEYNEASNPQVGRGHRGGVTSGSRSPYGSTRHPGSLSTNS
ncbi:unnamed protein product [Penicillium camemberti]|uniref:Str. FM013 n=1 Tax=Penicillium camemberti (strain FM 013) TaxID=1429867 RepID=A0A0G4PHV5_PENC3|nr:unnamed protein product [Penicillium camemberti]